MHCQRLKYKLQETDPSRYIACPDSSEAGGEMNILSTKQDQPPRPRSVFRAVILILHSKSNVLINVFIQSWVKTQVIKITRYILN